MPTTLPSPTPIGEKIEAALDRLDKKPAWLADRAGVERSTVTRIIKGDRNPTAETLSNIAPVLGFTLEELVAGTDAATRVQDAANLVSRAHFEAAVQQVVENEGRANDLYLQLLQLRDVLESERQRRHKAEAELQVAHYTLEEARREAFRHEEAARRYQLALEKAVANVAQLQTQVAELGRTIDNGRQTGRVAAILAGTAAVASVATYLSVDGSNERPNHSRKGTTRADTKKRSSRKR